MNTKLAHRRHGQRNGTLASTENGKSNGSAVMLDSSTIEILSLTEAAKTVPALNGKRISNATLWRWARKGIKRGATTVALRYVRIGRRIGIPSDALAEFFVALAEADKIERVAAQYQSLTPKRRTPEERAKAIARARRELASA